MPGVVVPADAAQAIAQLLGDREGDVMLTVSPRMFEVRLGKVRLSTVDASARRWLSVAAASRYDACLGAHGDVREDRYGAGADAALGQAQRIGELFVLDDELHAPSTHGCRPSPKFSRY